MPLPPQHPTHPRQPCNARVTEAEGKVFSSLAVLLSPSLCHSSRQCRAIISCSQLFHFLVFVFFLHKKLIFEDVCNGLDGFGELNILCGALYAKHPRRYGETFTIGKALKAASCAIIKILNMPSIWSRTRTATSGS